MSQQISGSRTLLWSVIMSSPGPLVVGLGLLAGKSSTQIADFVRRSSELLAIIMAYVTYRITTGAGREDPVRKQKLETASNLFVGAMMCLGGAIMLVLALISGETEKGNVIPGLTIALLGVIANTIFWRRYTQARLYRAKSLVDGCVTIALLSVAIAPQAAFSYYLDLIGSVIVAVYLVLCGIQTIREKLPKRA